MTKQTSAYCECRTPIYNTRRICVNCQRFVDLDPWCETCKGPLDNIPFEQQCAKCMHESAVKANNVAKRLFGCPPTGLCKHTMRVVR